jgi:hypothetical protein
MLVIRLSGKDLDNFEELVSFRVEKPRVGPGKGGERNLAPMDKARFKIPMIV